MHIPIKLIPQEIIDQYNLLALVSDGHVYVEVQKGMYVLPQAGILSNQLLARRLAIHGYHQTKNTPGLWRHVTRPIQFTLVVDDFGVQYVDKEHAEHLIDALEADYTVSKDWTGGLYCGITLKWNYVSKHVDLSMPGYIKDTLCKFQHPLPKRPQYAPYNWTITAYGQRIQYAPLPDAPPHNITRNNTCPRCCGYYPLQCARCRSNASGPIKRARFTIIHSNNNKNQSCVTSH
jgi:hypothetical protein